MADTKVVLPLRTEGDLIDAHEKIHNAVLDGSLDPKQVTAATRVLRGSKELIVDLPMDKLKLWLKCQTLKDKVPEKLMFALTGETEKQV